MRTGLLPKNAHFGGRFAWALGFATARGSPVLLTQLFNISDTLQVGSRRIEVLPTLHTVPAMGFAVLGAESGAAEGAGAWVFTGDTAPNPGLWQGLQSLKLASLVIETAIRNDECALAAVSRPLQPPRWGANCSNPRRVW